MNNPIIFYHNPLSRARTTHWLLEEIGAPYEIKLLDFSKREHKSPNFLAINPMGKVPTIVHNAVVVTESAAICAYLADAFPKANLAPAVGDPARGSYLRWLFFASGSLEPAVIDRMLKRPPAERPSAVGYGTFEDTIQTLETALKPGPFLLGDRFTAADLYLAAQIGFGMLLTKAIEPRPVFEKYLARCTDRPAYKRTQEQLQELMARLKG